MLTRRFYIDLLLILGVCVAVAAIFLMKGAVHTFNPGFLLASCASFWILEGVRAAHENGGDSLQLALWTRRLANLFYWLLPISVVLGFVA